MTSQLKVTQYTCKTVNICKLLVDAMLKGRGEEADIKRSIGVFALLFLARIFG